MYDLTAALVLQQVGEVRLCTSATVAIALVSVVIIPKAPTAPSIWRRAHI